MGGPGDIRFGEFTLNRARGRVEDAAGVERFLRPKSYLVLEVLAERCGCLVSKDELVRETWPNVVVSDDSLAHCVSDIRRALGSEAAGLLRTVPRRGYLLAAAENVRDEPALTGRGRVSIWAVALAVAAAAVVLAAGLWWALPDADERVLAPNEIELAVARADGLLEARDWRRRENNQRAREMLERVVATQPDHAAAWASLGLTYWLEVRHLAWGGGRREMERALEMVERSIALGSTSQSHRLLAEMRLLVPFPEMRSADDALASARAAVALGPQEPDNLAVLAQVLALTGRAQQGIGAIEQAIALDPNPPDWYRQVAGLAYLLSGEPARAAEEFGPLYGTGTFASTRLWSGWLYAASLAHAGRAEEAGQVIEAARRRRPEESVADVAQSMDGFAEPAGLATVLDGLRLAGMPG